MKGFYYPLSEKIVLLFFLNFLRHVQEEIVETRLKTLNIRANEENDISIDKAVEKVFQLLSREYSRSGGNLSLLEFTLDPNR